MATQQAYLHYYKSPPPEITRSSFPLNTIYSGLASSLTSAISSVAQSTVPRQEVEIGKVKIIFEAELCIVYVSTTTCFLVPYSMFLCFADMCSSWFSVDCYTWIHARKYPGYNLHVEFRECLQRMLSLLVENKQKTYTLLKMWPSLVIGSILRDLEYSPNFLTTIVEDLDPFLKRTSFYQHETAVVLSPIQAMLRLEMTGLWKVMGHPIVNMDASTTSWFSKGTVLKRDLRTAAVGIDNMFKKEFCRQYYKTHKKWPNLVMLVGTPDHIIACYNANEWGETSTYKWDPQDFQTILFHKTFEFNFHVDTIDIISDKAIIPSLPEFLGVFLGIF